MSNAANQFAHTVDSYAGALIEMSALRQYLRTRVGATGEYQRPAVGPRVHLHGRGGSGSHRQHAGGRRTQATAFLRRSRGLYRNPRQHRHLDPRHHSRHHGRRHGRDGGGDGRRRHRRRVRPPGHLQLAHQRRAFPSANLIAKADLAAVTYESLGELYEALLDQKVGDSPLFWILSNAVFIKGLVSPRFTNGRDQWFDGDRLLIHDGHPQQPRHRQQGGAVARRRHQPGRLGFDDIVVEVNTLDSVNYKYSMSQMFNFGSVHYETVARFT